jgi:hypothetical protein
MSDPAHGPRARWNRVRIAALAVLTAAVGPALAQDPPHWSSNSLQIDCTSQCHVTHHATGGALTDAADNVNLCQSCHVDSGLAGDLPIATGDKADPGNSGTSHAFDVPAVNAALDTQRPANTDMDLRVMDGNVVCSTCHNQHKAEASFGADARIGNPKTLTSNGSTADIVPGGDFNGAEGVWYLIEITQAGNEGNALFGYSKDRGLSWFPTDCTPGGVITGCRQADGTNPVTLDSGVQLTFPTGSYVLAERWEFSASYPFLRANIDSGDNLTGDVYCRDCHDTWVMDTADVRVYNSGAIKSHPVGVQLPGANPLYRSVDSNTQTVDGP